MDGELKEILKDGFKDVANKLKNIEYNTEQSYATNDTDDVCEKLDDMCDKLDTIIELLQNKF